MLKKELTECIDMTLLILATLRIEFKLANEQAQLTHIRERNPLAQRIHNIVKPKQNRDLLWYPPKFRKHFVSSGAPSRPCLLLVSLGMLFEGIFQYGVLLVDSLVFATGVATGVTFVATKTCSATTLSWYGGITGFFKYAGGADVACMRARSILWTKMSQLHHSPLLSPLLHPLLSAAVYPISEGAVTSPLHVTVPQPRRKGPFETPRDWAHSVRRYHKIVRVSEES